LAIAHDDKTVGAIAPQSRLIALAFCAAGDRVCYRPKLGFSMRHNLPRIPPREIILVTLENVTPKNGEDLRGLYLEAHDRSP
jgi:hypothetical protein